LVPQFQEAKKRFLEREIYRTKGEITDCVYELMQRISQAVNGFGQYLTQGFSYISDLDLRIKANERVLEQAGWLNELLCSFSFKELNEMAGRDKDINKLLMHHLSLTLTRSQSELLHSLHQLTEMLNNLRDYAEQSRLIGVFEAAYASDQGFSPSIDVLARIPKLLNRVAELPCKAYADITDVRYESDLANQCANLRLQPESEPEDLGPIRIDDGSDSDDDVEIEVDVTTSLSQVVINTVIHKGLSVYATEAYSKLPLECHPDIWVFALLGTVYALPMKQRRHIDIEFIESSDGVNPDSYLVSDIKLRPVHA